MSTSFWIIFMQGPQVMPSPAPVVSWSPYQAKKPLEMVSQMSKHPYNGPRKEPLDPSKASRVIYDLSVLQGLN